MQNLLSLSNANGAVFRLVSNISCFNCSIIRRLSYLQVKRKYIDVLFLSRILLASFYFQVRLRTRIYSNCLLSLLLE